MECLHHISEVKSFPRTPHHLRDPIQRKALKFLMDIQESESPVIGMLFSSNFKITFIALGILSGDLLAVFKSANIQVMSVLKDVTLSPSFYFPSNLLSVPCLEYNTLSAQFHCVKAWTMLPEFEAVCHEYFLQPRSKNEYLMFTKALLERGHIAGAKNLLERTLAFKWPETYRYCFPTDRVQNGL